MCLGAVCSAICCFGSACCSCICKGLSACGVPAKNFPKVAYLITDILFMALSVIMLYTMKPLFEEYDWLECNDSSGGGDRCFGTAAVMRASFILFLYHILILIFLIPRAHCSSYIHDGFFAFKFLLIIGGYIGSFWIHNDFFKGWAEFCRGGSILYLFIQAYFLLNFAYLWNDKLVEAQNTSQACYANFLLCGFSIILAVVNAAWLALQYVWYAGCGVGIYSVTLSLVFFIFYYAVALSKLCDVTIFRPNATVFVVGFSSTYVVYLSWTALASHPDIECNEMIDSGANTAMQIIIGTVFTFITMFSIATAAADPQGTKQAVGQDIIEEDTETAKPVTEEDKELAIFPVTFQTMFYQVIMVLLSLYFGMLFTNWGYAIVDGEIDKQTDNALFSMWVKLIAQIVTVLLFTISVMIYVCDQNRYI